MLTTQMLTHEIVRTVVGTMGLIAAVPITTALAALAARRTPNKVTAADKPARRHRRRASFAAEVRSGGWLDPALDPDPATNGWSGARSPVAEPVTGEREPPSGGGLAGRG